MSLFHKMSCSNFISKKNDRRDGFTVIEMVIVLAIMAILMLLVSVGLEGYNEAADRIERNEVAESSYYAVQSYLAMMKRQGELEEFTNSVKLYNLNTFGGIGGLEISKGQNAEVIRVNYEGSDFDTYYKNDYIVQHQDSLFTCMRLDAGDDEERKSNPLYPILFAALKDEDVLENSFFVEFDEKSGIVRSVFYSKDAESLAYHFSDDAYDEHYRDDETDIMYRNTASLDKKRQGYCGILETNGYRDNFALAEPENFMLVNGDRLYLTWDEANAAEAEFINGTYDLDNLIYEVSLYNKDGDIVAVYELPRRILHKELTGTREGILNYIDDMGEKIHDESNTMVTRAGYTELSFEEAEDGVAGEKYYVLLECLDHPFEDSGYNFSGEDEVYATLSLYYQEDVVNAERRVGFDETVVSNVESVYYAGIVEDGADKEFTIACNRHLWNVRNGLYTGDYRLIDDIDWANIEDRARNIAFESIEFRDEETLEQVYFQGTFNGTRESAGGVADVYRNSVVHEIHGITVYEEANNSVGLFALNQGMISDVVFSDFVIEGARHVGSVVGVNEGTIQNICVVDAQVKGNSELGGVAGSNKGTIKDAAVASVVTVVLPSGTDKISTGTIGRYIGGAVGYQYATGTMNHISSGVLVDETTGMTLVDSWEGKAGSAYVTAKRNTSDVTGIRAVGGIVGEIEDGAGEFKDLYNYAKLNATYVDEAERTARGDAESYMYQYFGGIVGQLHTSNTLRNCENHVMVSLDFKKDGAICDGNVIYDYIMATGTNGEFYNNPRFIGGIAGYSIGTIVDCSTQYTTHGTLEEELTGYRKVVNREEGVYVGNGVGGIVGMNAGTLLYTDAYTAGDLHVVVRGTKSVGGVVGQAISGSIQNNSAELKIEGVVTSQLEHAGGVVAYASGGTIGGIYINNGYIMGENAGGIAGYLGETLTLTDSNNTGVIYGRGNATTTRGYTGGIIGYNKGMANNCTNTGTVTVSHLLNAIPETAPEYEETYADIGGVVGYNTGTVLNCHSKLNTEKTNYIVGNDCCYTGGLVGRNAYNGLEHFGTIQTTVLETVDIPIIIGAIKQDSANTRTGGIIGVAEGVFSLQNFCYDGDINVKVDRSDTSIGTGGIIGYMSASQELSGCIFSGKIVSKMACTGGLAGNMRGGVITGTNVVSSDAIIDGANFTGGLVGYHECSSKANTRIDIVENRTNVQGSQYVGGFIGRVRYSQGFDLSDRTNYADITGEKYVGGFVGGYNVSESSEEQNAKNAGTITGNEAVGGIVGRASNENITTEHIFTNFINEGRIGNSEVNGSNLGGIIGSNETYIKLVQCENNGDVTGWAGIGGLIGAASNKDLAITITIRDCTNNATGTVAGKEHSVGGLVGSVGREDKSYINSITITNCNNYAQIASIKDIGGMIGRGINSTIDVDDCHNYGNIALHSESDNAISGVGGIVGHLTCNVEIPEGNIGNSTQNTDISISGKGGKTGGIVGICGVPMLIENCSFGTEEKNYNIYMTTDSDKNGGIVGYSTAELKINNCVSNADMSGTGEIYEIGGIVGRADGTLTIGEKGNSATYSKSYSDIDTTGNIRDAAGIIGLVSGGDYAIYGATNYGNIGAKSSEVTHVGGILGNSRLATYEEEAFGTMDSCTQLGQIYQVSNHVGGMLGQNDFYSTTIRNCQNGSADVAESGKIYVTVAKTPGTIGGLVGGSEGMNAADEFKRNLVIESSKNYGEIYINASAGLAQYIGGLVGYQYTGNIDIFASTDNYGDVVVKGAKAEYIGGFVGRAEGSYLYVGSPTSDTDKTEPTMDCANYGDLRFENGSVGRFVGGIVGRAKEAGFYGTYNEGNIIPDDTGSYVSAVGGIAGYLEGTTLIQDVNQIGNMKNIVFDDVQVTAGGIVGVLEGTATIRRTNNGSQEAHDAGVEAGCIYVKQAADGRRPEAVGGIIGRNTATLTMTECNNYADINSAFSTYDVGGIIGRSEGTLTMGSLTDPFDGVRNYGNIKAVDGAEMCQTGGIIGKVTNNLTLYNCENYGNLAPGNSGYLIRSGGIVGCLDSAGLCTAVIDNCSQKATIYNVKGDGYAGAGGIVGYANIALTVNSCTNDGSIYMMPDVQRVGGIIGGNNKTVSLNNCTNNGILSGTGKAEYVGGILGNGSAQVLLDNCVNNADLTGTELYAVGGIVGRLSDTNGENNINNCKQYGNIYNVKGSDANAGAGGILGFNESVTVITNCVNGQKGATDKGKIVALNGAIRVGGIVGASWTQATTLDNCVTYGSVEAQGELSYSGGLVGAANCVLSVDNCINNIGFSMKNTGKVLGGMVGQSIGPIQVGLSEEEGSFGFKNYGDMYADGGDITDVGGVVGLLEGAATIHKAENYGDILGQTTGGNTNAGGICGHVVGTQNIEIFACGSYGNIRNGDYLGGVIGHALGTGELRIENCYAIGEIRTTGANKGALIGFTDSPNVFVLKDSYGRADITDGNNVIFSPGNWLTDADYTFRGGTNGEFSQNVYNTMCTVFGIENRWDDDDWSENVRYLMINYKE